tara:strand:+ start:525 stop:962 length:438 start_codon:yes stop_codon:yes gene_type:complete
MTKHTYERSFDVKSEKMTDLWNKLNLRNTFVDGQIFPYKVEFDAPQQNGPFAEGELNIHHGPLLSVHGMIGEVNDQYRGLEYFYGSYVISFRLVRPLRLEFFNESDKLRLKLTVYVKPWFKPIWKLGNDTFWGLLGIKFLLTDKD